MATTDPRVDVYIEKAQPFARPVLRHIRALVHRAVPDVEETMKWSFPHFQYQGMLCSMAAFKQHCAFGFWNHSMMTEDQKSADAMGQFGRIASVDDLPADRTFVSLVKQAAALNVAGVKPKRVIRTPKPALEPPQDLLAALKKNKRAATAFDGFPPSHRREYIEWITEAKTEATRARRLTTAVEWIAEGKGRNWKYER